MTCVVWKTVRRVDIFVAVALHADVGVLARAQRGQRGVATKGMN